LAVITLFFTLPYPLTPSQLSLVSGVTIGIPAFFLAMEPNENRISGRFLRNVLARALPAALTDLAMVLGVMAFYLAFALPMDTLSTICALVICTVRSGHALPHQSAHETLSLGAASGMIAAFLFCLINLPALSLSPAGYSGQVVRGVHSLSIPVFYLLGRGNGGAFVPEAKK
jgi:magnesium-transporting ATPase (P-type)